MITLKEELLALVAEQQQQITQLQGQLAKATATIESLQVEVERLTRRSKRQATPFSKGTRAKHPKRPGCKPGRALSLSTKPTAPGNLPASSECASDQGVLPQLV